MEPSELKKMGLGSAISLTAEVCGADISVDAARVMARELKVYPPETVAEALRVMCRRHKGRFALDDILKRIDELDGRPGPEEAWAIAPKDEYSSAVLCEEILQALVVAMPIYNDGDRIGARMAFREKYSALCAAARERKTPVCWHVSLGYDQSGRISAIAAAVAAQRITVDQAREMVTPEQYGSLVLALPSGQLPSLPAAAPAVLLALGGSRGIPLKNQTEASK